MLRTTDAGHLAEAIERGLCSAVHFEPSADEENYCEGVSTQPRHIASGLLFQSECLLAALFGRLSVTVVLSLTGPSGVGESSRARSFTPSTDVPKRRGPGQRQGHPELAVVHARLAHSQRGALGDGLAEVPLAET